MTVLLVLLMALVSAGPLRAEDEAGREYNKGRQFDAAGLPKLALEHYQAALHADNTFYQASRQIGACYYRLGKYEESLAAYRAYLAHVNDPATRRYVDWLDSTPHVYLTRRDGSNVWGMVVKETLTSLTVKTPDKQLVLSKSDLWFRQDFRPRAVAVEPTHRAPSALVAGVCAGTLPVYGVLGYRLNNLDAKLMAGHLGPAGWGGQVQLGGTVYDKDGLSQEAIFFGGAGTAQGWGQPAANVESYFGAGYEINWKGWDAQLGLTWNQDERFFAPVMLQIGYLWDL